MKFCFHSRAIMLMIFSLAAFATSSDDPEIPSNFMGNPWGAVNSLENAAVDLKTEKERMRNEISDLQTRLNNRPQSVLEIEQKFPGGANQQDMVSECPSGQVMVGIEITTGDDCNEYCKNYGRPLRAFKIICASSFNKQQIP